MEYGIFITERMQPMASKSKSIIGGMTVLDLPDRAAAEFWAAKFAAACRCAQEIRVLF